MTNPIDHIKEIQSICRELDAACANYYAERLALMDLSLTAYSYTKLEMQAELKRQEEMWLGAALDAIEQMLDCVARNSFANGPDLPIQVSTDLIGEHFGIAAMLVDDCILVRLPLLPPKYRQGGWTSSGRRVKDYGHLFAYQVSVEMRRVLDAVTDEELMRFWDKTISIFYVYAADGTQALDSDNHDTKAVTDAITGNLPGGDDAERCAFFLSTIRSDEVPQGTYIIVAPGHGITRPQMALKLFKGDCAREK